MTDRPTSRNVKFCLISEESMTWEITYPVAIICAHMCTTNCDLSCSSRAVRFWTTRSLHGVRRMLFRRILWTVVCGIYNSPFAGELDFFGLFMRSPRPPSTMSLLPAPLHCSYRFLMLLSSGHLIPHSRLHSRWTWTMDSNSAYHNKVCVFCCTVDTVLAAQLG
jgi:hypothetical protein